MNRNHYLGLTESTGAAFAAIHAGRRQVDSARRAHDPRAERDARRRVEEARKVAREAAEAWN